MAKSDKPSGRAIITFARGWQALVATRSLGQRGIEVITGDEYAMTPASLSRYSITDFRYPNATHNPEGFLDTLEAVVLKYKPKDPTVPYVLMPIHKETYLIARHRDRFEPHIHVPLSTIDHIEQVHNKGTLAAEAIQHGLSIPHTWLPNTLVEFHSMVSEMPYPIFVKLRESAAGVGIRKVDNQQQLEFTFKEFIDHFQLKEGNYPILQQAVPGEDYCVTTLFDHGKLLACMTYHNLRAFPAEKGAGVLRETVNVPAMEQISSALLSPMGWHGVAQLDFRWDGDSQSPPYLIEVNPRFWGGLIQAVESGWDYPWLLFQLASGGHVDLREEKRFDVRTETPILALLATIQELSNSNAHMEGLKILWSSAKTEFQQGSKRTSIRKILNATKQVLKPQQRYAEAKRLFHEHEGNIYDILSSEDPLPALGILYPMAVFFKHGKITMELITGETGPSADND